MVEPEDRRRLGGMALPVVIFAVVLVIFLVIGIAVL